MSDEEISNMEDKIWKKTNEEILRHNGGTIIIQCDGKVKFRQQKIGEAMEIRLNEICK